MMSIRKCQLLSAILIFVTGCREQAAVPLASAPTVLPEEHVIDNGGDTVDIRYFEAKSKLTEVVAGLSFEVLYRSELSVETSKWLTHSIGGETRYEKLKQVISETEISFGENLCEQSDLSEREACYLLEPHKKILVNRTLNQNTTADEAFALLFHEYGHLIGEQDHVLLARMGADIVQPEVLLTLKYFSLKGYPILAVPLIRPAENLERLQRDVAWSLCTSMGFEFASHWSIGKLQYRDSRYVWNPFTDQGQDGINALVELKLDVRPVVEVYKTLSCAFF